jgi:hypothetical protein
MLLVTKCRGRVTKGCEVLIVGARHALSSVMQTPAHPKSGRRRFLGALGACAMARPVASSAQALTQAHGALTKEQRDRLTPTQVLDELKKGNQRFRSGAMVPGRSGNEGDHPDCRRHVRPEHRRAGVPQ